MIRLLPHIGVGWDAKKEFTLRSEKNTMNTKTKMMLGLSVLTAGTLAAGATGTFAWFTTNKTATATYSNIIAAGTQGNIAASITGITDTAAKTTGDPVTEAKVLGSSSYISDVSSNDGIKFVQPDWVGESGNSKTANSLIDVSKKTGYFTQYNVTIKNTTAKDTTTTGNAEVKVELSGMTITTSATSFDTSWVRVAIITGSNFSAIGETTGTTAGVYTSAVTKGTNDKYVSALKDDKTLTLSDADVKAVTDLSTNKITVKDSLAAGATETIGISVWLEGTANSTGSQDNAKGQTVEVKLEFTATAIA